MATQGFAFDGAPVSPDTAIPVVSAQPGAAPKINAKMIRLYVRIALFLTRTAGMGYRAIHRRPNLLGILPQRT